MATNTPTPPKGNPYRRDACLFQIALSALMQLQQDALGVEQEDLALASRLQAITMQVQIISQNDPLLK